MELIRKITRTGHSKAIIVPNEWLESIRNQTGKEVKFIKLTLNGNIVIEPYFPKAGK